MIDTESRSLRTTNLVFNIYLVLFADVQMLQGDLSWLDDWIDE